MKKKARHQQYRKHKIIAKRGISRGAASLKRNGGALHVKHRRLAAAAWRREMKLKAASTAARRGGVSGIEHVSNKQRNNHLA